MPLSTLLPLLAAFIYAGGALLAKRSADLGVGVWRTAFIANVVGAIVFLPLFALGGHILTDRWWQPVVAGFVFTVGQFFTFLALDRGDVSVATPVLGLKILFVALLVTAAGTEPLRPALWMAALLATAGIALLNRRAGHAAHHRVGRTILTAGSAAAAFAVFDVIVQKWAPAWGAGRFVPFTMLAAATFGLAFIPLFRAPLRAIPRPAWPWLLVGTAVIAAQSALFVMTVAHWGQVASANVLYSSRGLWSVVLVGLFGHWVRSREQDVGRAILLWRLAGAALMMAAIALTLR